LSWAQDEYESTPHSGGYYHTAATYWANGVLNTLTGPGQYSNNYGVDGEGRIYSAGGGVNLASTTYNAASQPTIVIFGSLDSDSFTYDPNTGRMMQYQFNVNGQSVTGAVTWNPNGTLQKLNITDPFNSANTQTCKYGDPTANPPVAGYDDLGRLASGNCGPIWSQTFSYDAFGNITKTGSSQFQPTYSYATNQMSSIGSFTPTYDSNGDVLNDGLHSYAWDAETRPTTIDTVAATYDALDRMVEQTKSGTSTEIEYSPTGFQMNLLNGQTAIKAFVPMPGGTEEVWQAGGHYYRHSDWLGSSRFASTSTRTMYNDLAYAPFGEQYAQAGNPGVTDTSFAGNDENTVANLYDAHFREYGIQGRWPSADPAGFAAADPSNPQSWNRYAYVMNNPLALSDPQGTDPCTATSSPQDCPNGGGGIASGCIGAEPGSSTFQQCGGWLGYAGMSPWAWFRTFDPFDLLGYFYVGENGDVGWGNHLPAFLGNFGDDSNLWPSNLSGMPQTPTPPKKPCTQLQNQAKGITELAEADHAVEGPLLFPLVPAGSAFALGTMGYATALACVPEPGAIIACPLMVGVDLFGGGAIVYGNYKYFQSAGSIWKKLTGSPTPPTATASACGG